MYPVLIINKRISQVEKLLSEKGVIVVKIREPEDIKHAVLNYSHVIGGDKPIAFSDIMLAGKATSRLLKFVEENENMFIGVASRDGLDSILMSRFRTIRKVPDIVENETPNENPELDEEASYYQKLVAMVRHSPQKYPAYHHLRASRLPSQSKIEELLC